ncbi:head maturation protease, ClpP-related [Paraburkholderia susongensis]|uniref:ATP-dependent Clp protease, protease subunit n=1 Tax=Paraburkholderia susongensis TaxID=1515439 RepID=A0A1X7I5R7_9BURK|nr:head maturation protease, ClpP-related [Paraburkholderia susongensis]SMG09597.1 ATP-dependent Clp protease, protease subunit [Paraburkholderia susongensis]
MKNRLLQLLSDNRSTLRYFRAEATTADEATIWLYDVIVDDDYWGGVGALTFAQTLAAITAPTIHLRVNSPGGDVFAGRAIETAIREHPSRVIGHIDGLAASAASFVVLGADEIEISDGAFVMIHKGWTYTWGNADELRKTASLLDQVDASLVRTYAAETGETEADIAAWMADETWFDAAAAIEKGFADRLAGTAGSSAAARASTWNLAAFSNVPEMQDALRAAAAVARASSVPASSSPTAPALPPAPAASTTAVLPVPDFAAMKRRLNLAQQL